MTKTDRIWLSRVAALGCIVCKNLGFGETPAEIHHVRTGQGAGQRADHRKTIPLCHQHHRVGGHGVAIHAGKKTWEQKYGSETELLIQVVSELDGDW
ncbi:Protein of uncharacterised function (DUF968) [Salmonella enterica subsp. salamae]|nr:DUF968 domain-containing protein [Salmonella enterica]VEA60281.1 Protein of uncharacterised function (DUF968) [Salmonella enterica subsp. salamae]HAV0413634.1 DUF968 domain-containing protein [Salmonella enterica]HCM1942181.1 DUF968 domain-containing protein [Salmonella enterica subsp. salamae serovar 30:g,m,s:e,n,x]